VGSLVLRRNRTASCPPVIGEYCFVCLFFFFAVTHCYYFFSLWQRIAHLSHELKVELRRVTRSLVPVISLPAAPSYMSVDMPPSYSQAAVGSTPMAPRIAEPLSSETIRAHTISDSLRTGVLRAALRPFMGGAPASNMPSTAQLQTRTSPERGELQPRAPMSRLPNDFEETGLSGSDGGIRIPEPPEVPSTMTLNRPEPVTQPPLEEIPQPGPERPFSDADAERAETQEREKTVSQESLTK